METIFTPSLPAHTDKEQAQASLHSLRNGPPLPRICCPLRTQVLASRNDIQTQKKPTMCKTWYVSCWKQPTAELSHLCSFSWPSLPPSFSSQREIWGFHFYCRPQLICLFYKRFLHLDRHKIRIQFSRTAINCQPSLLICIFCPWEIFLIFTVLHPSLIIPAFSYHLLSFPIHNLPNYISYPLLIEMK